MYREPRGWPSCVFGLLFMGLVCWAGCEGWRFMDGPTAYELQESLDLLRDQGFTVWDADGYEVESFIVEGRP
jgi:hypothetical protein